MKDAIERTQRLAGAVSLFFANLAAVILLVLVALTCVDVVGRYFFSAPLVGAVELVRICMAAIIFFSFPFMFLRNDHIIVDLFAFVRRGWTGWVLALAILALTIVVAVVLGDRVLGYAQRAFTDGDTTEYLFIPRWPIVGLIAVSIYAAALMCLLRIAGLLATPGQLPDEERHEEGL